MRRNPDIQLSKPFLPNLFLSLEVGRSRAIGCVNANSKERVSVARPTVFPGAGDADCVFGDAAKALAQLGGGLIEFLGFNIRAVVIVQR